MSLTVSEIITNFNTYVGDSSTDRISAAERLQYVTEATVWLQEQLKNDHQVQTYDLTYIDTVNYYLVTTPLADLLQGADLRRSVGSNHSSMTAKSSRELAEEIANGVVGDDSWAIERRDGRTYLVINALPKNRATMIDDFESSTTVAYWVADNTNSDAENVTFDQNLFSKGSGSLNFDIDVSDSVADNAVLDNTTLSVDLSAFESTGVFLLDVYLPTVDTISSFTLRWGQDSSNYWTTTVTTDLDGSAFVTGWNTLAFDWAVATSVGSPVTTSEIDYWKFTMTYGAGQVDETDYRLDNFRIANTEDLKFYYVSWVVGTDTTGATERLAFSATTDIPYFSGKYDQYKYAVAHKAASLAFRSLRLKNEATLEEGEAFLALRRAQNTFPSSVSPEVKSFKVKGVNLNK